MPTTITAYYDFTPGTTIFSAQVDENFSNHRGTNIPISESTGTGEDATHDLGTTEYRWRDVHSSRNIYHGVDNNITAFAGGGQTSATALTNDLSIVTTVASSDDSVLLPSATGGMHFTVVNDGANTLAVYPTGSEVINATTASYAVSPTYHTIFISDSTGSWRTLDSPGSASQADPVVTTYLSGSGTHTITANCTWLEFWLRGAGAGGGPGGTAVGSTATSGGTSQFSDATAGGGTFGTQGGTNGGAGGTANLGSSMTGLAIPGAAGDSCSINSGLSLACKGGKGGGAGGGSGGVNSTAGGIGATNSGGGGGGGGCNSTATNQSGSGGGEGGFVYGIIYAPASTYPYAVGAAGSGGSSGGNGDPGGSGAAGSLLIKEHFT